MTDAYLLELYIKEISYKFIEYFISLLQNNRLDQVPLA